MNQNMNQNANQRTYRKVKNLVENAAKNVVSARKLAEKPYTIDDTEWVRNRGGALFSGAGLHGIGQDFFLVSSQKIQYTIT